MSAADVKGEKFMHSNFGGLEGPGSDGDDAAPDIEAFDDDGISHK
jgi:hypothetical protein